MPWRSPSRKGLGTVGLLSIFCDHVLLLVSLLLRLFFEVTSADKPAGDALPDNSEDGLTAIHSLSICPMWDSWAPYCMCLGGLVHG